MYLEVKQDNPTWVTLNTHAHFKILWAHKLGDKRANNIWVRSTNITYFSILTSSLLFRSFYTVPVTLTLLSCWKSSSVHKLCNVWVVGEDYFHVKFNLIITDDIRGRCTLKINNHIWSSVKLAVHVECFLSLFNIWAATRLGSAWAVSCCRPHYSYIT